MNGKDCLYPDEFIAALLDSGHTIDVCPRSAITTFGVAVCIKEDDKSRTNVPIGLFFSDRLRTTRSTTDILLCTSWWYGFKGKFEDMIIFHTENVRCCSHHSIHFLVASLDRSKVPW